MKQSEVKPGTKLHIKVENKTHSQHGKVIEAKVTEVMNINKPPFQFFSLEGSIFPVPADRFEEFKPKPTTLKFDVALGDGEDTPYREATDAAINEAPYIYVKVGNIDLHIAAYPDTVYVHAYPREDHPAFKESGGLQNIGALSVNH